MRNRVSGSNKTRGKKKRAVITAPAPRKAVSAAQTVRLLLNLSPTSLLVQQFRVPALAHKFVL